MSKTAMIRARMEPEVKLQAEEILHSLGLSQTEAINIFYHQVIINKGLPFDVKLPNKKTIEAIEEAKSEQGERFSSTKELYKSLGI